ncbi:hypothetical protein SAMN04515680_0072 [Leifsonia sp. 21MFCrub1.1]|nr:hypothetical protein SAMN04515680_0072 [Leifsonia sp. 21MFCrub1.1]
MSETTDQATSADNPTPFLIRGYLFLCPVCLKTDAERIRLGPGTPKEDGTPQDLYQCADEDCRKEFEDDAWVKVPASQATIGDDFKH